MGIYLGALVGLILVVLMVQHTPGRRRPGHRALVVADLHPVFIMPRSNATKVERERMMLAMVLVFGAVVFWTLFEQAGSSLSLFADRNVNLDLIGAQANPGSAASVVLGTPEQLAAAGIDTTGSVWVNTASPPPRPSRSTPASS
jgi:POT family proton-dependent oligopeptide transporter